MRTWEHKIHGDLRTWDIRTRGHWNMRTSEHKGHEEIGTLRNEDMGTNICLTAELQKMATLNSLSNTTQYGICWWTLKALWFILVG